ncbi:hypothetical protein BRARA_G01196 [Brassica rapa]|uniref:RING-type E3 ubiquitin transferase n=3 Tax=Brassica campestris TaxID=3711 RepID=A0A397YSN6_BRACM|nr:E3 ubiquitin-protein ligase RNF38 isoform X2 [Brassica rapa]RID53826.1 hypothetical protein BRARA_G01196 [Brassica rapa]
MDQNMNDFSESDTPFSFEQLLYGDDWQRWDTYPSVDVNANSIEPNHSMVEMNHDGMTIDATPISMIYPMEETFEQWLQTLANGSFEIPSYEELNFTYEELLLMSEQIGDVCIGVDVDIIEGNLKRRKYEDRSGQAEKCVICLDELKCNDEASTLACGHDFHYECIKNWLMVKNKCPLCKQQAL